MPLAFDDVVLQPVAFVTFENRAGAEEAKAALQVGTAGTLALI